MARLIVETAEGGRTVELEGERTLTVGRDPTNDLPFPAETKASRRHCRIAPVRGGGWEVADLGSTNKTRVSGSVVERKVLSSGDVIEVGQVRIRYEDPEEEARLKDASSKGVCYLEWATADRKGQKILLQGQRTSLGRRDSNTIPLPQDRMASGHHAEIVRDLNGYTIRDLGSTNGTLVNGQPTTDAVLSHGTRVRVGNSRFVFKDPSMKDIEVELEKFDEDEGWGMMGEIDVSRARGSGWTAVALLLPLVAAGVGFWWLSTHAPTPSTVSADAGGRIENGTFEGEEIPWVADQDVGVELKRVDAPSRKGSALSLVHGGEADVGPVLVSYVGDLPRVARHPYRIRARLKAGSGDSDFVVVWESRPEKPELQAGVVPLTQTIVLGRGASGSTLIDVRVVPPVWCDGGRIAVRLAPGARAVLDDVSVDLGTSDAPQPTFSDPDATRSLTVNSWGGADLVASRTVLSAGATAVARAAGSEQTLRFEPAEVPEGGDGRSVELKGSFRGGEKELAGQVRWSVTEEGFRAEVSCEGAELVGLSTDLVAAHLGGVVNLLGAFPPQPLPAQPGQRLEKVAKALAGDPLPSGARPPTLVAYVAGGQPTATVEFVPADDPGVARWIQWNAGSRAAFDIVTTFRLQAQKADTRLTEATGLLQERPGQAIRLLRVIAREFPFDARIGGEALRLADTRETAARRDIDALDAGLQGFRVYRSPDALEAVEVKARALRKEFLPEGGPPPAEAGQLESRVDELVRAVADERREFDRQNALPEVIHLQRVVALLEENEEHRPLAALFARAILSRFGAWAGDDSDIGRRVQAARERLDSLTSSEVVNASLPPEPGKSGK